MMHSVASLSTIRSVMLSKSLACCTSILFLLPVAVLAGGNGFLFNGFNGNGSWALSGSAEILTNHVLSLSRAAFGYFTYGNAFYHSPFQVRNLTDDSLVSFSATFTVAIIPPIGFREQSQSDGIAFVLAPNTTTVRSGEFGLLQPEDNGKPSNHLLFVELDTNYNEEFDDIDDNHVGINVNSLNSSWSSPAGYYTDDDLPNLHPLRLSSGTSVKELQVWIDYDHELRQLNVSLAPIPLPKPKHPLLSPTIDLSPVLLNHMYIGFSARSYNGDRYYILGCTFNVGNRKRAASLDYSKLPRINTTQLRGQAMKNKVPRAVMPSWVTFICLGFLMSLLVVAMILAVRGCCRSREIREDWEAEFGPHRFSYRDLYDATDAFTDRRLLGAGGFGKVYKGVLSSSQSEVAVKVMIHDSKQGMKEFIAEVVSMGRLRHRNLVQLLGYCRRRGELLLVYEYMPNGSLDKHLYDLERPPLDWAHRFDIIRGVASGLFYLHEEWEQVVIHRDIKAGNVLLDADMNGRLGDFGLARLHDHGVEAHTTCVAGTRGYISPELARLGKATKATDVFAFGAFVLEVACGRRPIGLNTRGEPQVLVDFVLRFWQRGLTVCMVDPRLGEEYVTEEAELVLKLGLLCSHPSPVSRPTMRLVMQYLCGDAPFPEMPDAYLNIRSILELHGEGVYAADDQYGAQYTSSVQTSITSSLSLSGGR